MGRPRIHTNPDGTYGRLTTVMEVAGTPYSRNFLCRCECGNEIVVTLSRLLSGNTKSCGCYKKNVNKERLTKHGLSGSRIYHTYRLMRERCGNPNNKSFKDYGARGIAVCSEWAVFENFRDWAFSNGYADNLTIERKDNDKGYGPDNCRWIPKAEQSKNRRPYEINHKDPTTGRFTSKLTKGGKHGNSKCSSSKTGTGSNIHRKTGNGPRPYEENRR